MDTDELIRKIRHRVEQCRRLAKHVGDQNVSKTLLQMAEEGEADIKRLETEGDRT